MWVSTPTEKDGMEDEELGTSDEAHIEDGEL